MNASIDFSGVLEGSIAGEGGGGSEVVITPVVTSGTKIADVSVDGVEKDLYCPTPATPQEVVITPVVISGTKIADVSIDGVEKDLYCPTMTPTEVIITQVQQSGTKIATIGVNGVNTDLYAPNGGGSDIYTSNEQRVGTWIDGKTLYQKTISFSVVGDNNYHRYEHGIQDIDIIFVDQSASFVYYGSSTYPLIGYGGSPQSSQMGVLVWSGGFDYRAGVECNGATCYATLKYTKTTDSI